MATKIYEEVVLATQAGTELTVRPLTIKSLRAFMTKMKELDGEEEVSDEKGLGVMFDAAVIAIRQCNKELSEEKLAELEDELDVPTINRILEVAGGIKVENPSLQPTQAA